MKRLWNLLRYIIVIVLDILIMVTFHSYINFLLLIGLILLPVYSVFSIYVVKSQLNLDVLVPLEDMKKGEEFYVRFILHNPTLFPLLNVTLSVIVGNHFYLEYGNHTLNLPARAKTDTKVDYPVVMDYCGRFMVSVTEMHLMDLLGIYEVKIPLSIEKECLIFPNGHPRNQEAGAMYLRGVTESVESKEKGYDFSEISGIREYIPGDKLQNIHWKLSVKKDELMVKERVSVSAQQLNVLVELVNDDSMCLESILELTDSITKSFVEMGFPFTLCYYSSNLGELRETYIGNAIERKTCMEMILFERSYRDMDLAERVYIKDYGAGTYLYIGCNMESDTSGISIAGTGNVVAQLRTKE